MILIGQYDSPFVRRVAIALHLYGMSYEHQPWSVFRDTELIAPYNPLSRVPTLVLDDGTALIDSHLILDALDHMAGTDRALMPADGPGRFAALRVCGLATGMAEKAVALMYERLWHDAVSPDWTQRCTRQITRVLTILENERAGINGAYWNTGGIGHADIITACAYRFASEAHPDLFESDPWPALRRHTEACETLPVFQEIKQPLIVPR